MGAPLRRFTPHVVVFLGSLAIMIIELVASRLVAKYFGNSLYTWTGVIGIVLGGISLGNYLGGRIADRFEPSVAIIPVLLASAAATLLILPLDTLLARTMGATGGTLSALFVLRSVAVIALLFLAPATALGAISPIMAKYALVHRAVIGRTVGNLYAVSSVGSIAGTFLAGFVLIPLFDLRAIISLIGLLVASLSFLIQGRRVLAAGGTVAFLLLGAGAFLVNERGSAHEPGGTVLYAGFTQYSYVKVKDLTAGSSPRMERVLIMDGLIHNRHDLRNHDHLLYDYEKIFDAVTRSVAPSPEEASRLRALTLGGGAMTFPAFLSRNLHPAENLVVEIDPRVARIAHRYFDVPERFGPTVAIGDARAIASGLRGNRTYDIVYLDAFNSFAVPYHLTTVEFMKVVADLLTPSGVLAANAIDILDSGLFVTGYFNSLSRVFRHVSIYADPTMTPHTRSTFVLCASKSRRLPTVLRDATGAPVAYALDSVTMLGLLEKNGSAPYSDYFAPVDNALAPVFLRALR